MCKICGRLEKWPQSAALFYRRERNCTNKSIENEHFCIAYCQQHRGRVDKFGSSFWRLSRWLVFTLYIRSHYVCEEYEKKIRVNTVWKMARFTVKPVTQQYRISDFFYELLLSIYSKLDATSEQEEQATRMINFSYILVGSIKTCRRQTMDPTWPNGEVVHFPVRLDGSVWRGKIDSIFFYEKRRKRKLIGQLYCSWNSIRILLFSTTEFATSDGVIPPRN